MRKINAESLRPVLLAGLLAASAAQGAPETLTIEGYLAQVREGNEAVRGATEAAEAARLRSEEGSLLLAPTLSGGVNFARDEKPNALFQALRGSSIHTYNLGLSKVWGASGTSTKLSYNLLSYEYSFAGGGAGLSSFYEARPAIEITQPLWRNFFGRETRANQTVLEAQTLAAHHQSAFQSQAALASAEATYWRLSLARAVEAIEAAALERSERLHEWSRKRASLQLADRSDLLQAEANLEIHRLQVQSARDETRAAGLAFNEARGSAAEDVPERLTDLGEHRLEDARAPRRAELRRDVQAARELERAAVARSEIGLSTESPTLELYGSYALNGQRTGRGEAISDSFKTDLPSSVVGIRFSAPLDLPVILRAREGYARDRTAAELTFRRRTFEAEREWTDLTAKLAEARKRLELARAIEDVQERKVVHERERLSRGRTTLYQVLTFEQDYSQARFARLRAQADVLMTIARLRLFEEPGEPK